MPYKMQIDLFGNSVTANTDGYLVNLNELCNAGNAWRLSNGRPIYQLPKFLESKTLADYLPAAAKEWGMPISSFLTKSGKGKSSCTMAHVSVALLLAEQISPEVHAKVHRVFIEGKLLDFRMMGGTEFKSVNVAIDSFLPGRNGKDNKGIYIQTAIKLRTKLLGKDAKLGDWDNATVAQTHARYEAESTIVKLLSLGVVRDYDHLNELIDKIL